MFSNEVASKKAPLLGKVSLTSNTTTHIPIAVVLTKICRHRL